MPGPSSRIEKNYVVRNGQRREKETKTDADRRLSLDPLSVQMLIDYERQRTERLAPAHLELAAAAFVFSPDPMGTRPWHPDHFSHAYRKLTDVLGITEPLKNLRQFNATQLLAAGVDLRTTAGAEGAGQLVRARQQHGSAGRRCAGGGGRGGSSGSALDRGADDKLTTHQARNGAACLEDAERIDDPPDPRTPLGR